MGSLLRTYREAFSGLPRAIWLLAAISLINRAGTMVLPFLAIYLTEALLLDEILVGPLFAVYGLGAGLGVILAGRLVDRTSPKTVMVGSLAASAVLLLVLARAKTPLSIGASLFALSVVSEAFRPANGAAVARNCPSELTGQAFGLVRLAINLGMTLGSAIGGFLAETDFAWLFRLDSATCLAAAGFTLFAVEGIPKAADRSAATMSEPSKSPWRDPRFLLVMGGLLLISILFIQLFSLWPLHHREALGFPRAALGLLFAVNTLVIIAFEMVLMHRLRHRSKLAMLGLGAALLGLGLGVIPLLGLIPKTMPTKMESLGDTLSVLSSSNFLFASAAVLLWTAGEMLIGPTAAAWVAHRAPRAALGSYMGLFNLAFASGHVLGPALGSLIYTELGPNTLWIGCGVLGVSLWPALNHLGSRDQAGERVTPTSNR